MDSVIPAARPGIRKARASRFRLELALAPLVLVGDWDPQVRRALTAILRRKGYRVRAYKTAEDLVRQLAESRGDLDMPEHVIVGVASDDQEVLAELGALHLTSGLPPTIVLLPGDVAELAHAARRSGATRVIDRARALSLLPSAVADAAPGEWADRE